MGCFLHLQNVWLGNLISDRRWQDLVSCHVHHFRVCRGPTNERVEEDSTGAADETDGSLPTLCSQSTAQQVIELLALWPVEGFDDINWNQNGVENNACDENLINARV